MIPGVPSDKEYKITRRLWKKPRRFTPDQYYGTTDTGNSGSSSSDDSSSYYSDGDSDY